MDLRLKLSNYRIFAPAKKIYRLKMMQYFRYFQNIFCTSLQTKITWLYCNTNHLFKFKSYILSYMFIIVWAKAKQWGSILLLILIVQLFYCKKFSGNKIGLHIDAKLKKTCFIKFLKRWFYASLVYLKPNASKLSNKKSNSLRRKWKSLNTFSTIY